MAVSARPSAPETAGKRLDPKPAARQATVAPSSSPVSVQRPPPQPSLQQLPKLQQPQLLPTDLSMDGLSWVSLGILAALVQVSAPTSRHVWCVDNPPAATGCVACTKGSAPTTCRGSAWKSHSHDRHV